MKTIYNVRPKGLNVGNDAIAVAMQKFIYEACGELVNIVTIPATSKYDGGGLYGLTKRSIHEFNQHADGVIVGGGNLFENGEIDIDENALKALRVPLMSFSVSRGKIFGKDYKLVDRTDVIADSKLLALTKRTDINLSRDTATVDYIRAIGGDSDLGICPTIYLKDIEQRLPGITEIGKHYRDTVVISIRNPDLMSIPIIDQSQVRKDIERIAKRLIEEGNEVKILCHDTRDISFSCSLGMPYIYTGDVFSYLSMIKNCKLLISYRLHSFLPALSFGTPCIKISYDQRALSLINDIGYGSWNINMFEERDVEKAVFDRIDRIDELKELVTMNALLWKSYHGTILRAFESFNQLMINSR